MKKLLFILLIFASINVFGCRFTIRDIGYTRLNIETYVVQLKTDTVLNMALVNHFKNIANSYSINSNINYSISHKPGQSPVLTCRNSVGKIIVQEKNISGNGIEAFYKKLLYSPVQKMMYNQIGNVFAFVVGFYDDDSKHVDNVINKAFEQFIKISPNLDKKVDESLMKIVIRKEKLGEEQLILNALGIDTKSSLPVVVVLYGRGRLTGVPLAGDDITTHNLLNQLVTLGTDCECGIDLSPLLQQAIPFNWSTEINQSVTNMLDIDVENPMVLTEMSRILSKEPLETGKSDFSYVPQTIDLDKELAKGKIPNNEVIVEQSNALKITAFVFGILFIVAIIIGLLFFKRK